MRTLHAQVLDANSNDPLPGAIVWVRKLGRTDGPVHEEVVRLGWDAYLAQWAAPHACDGDGRVTLPELDGSPTLVASWHHWIGTLKAPLEPNAHVAIRASALFPLVLRVLDPLDGPQTYGPTRLSVGAESYQLAMGGGPRSLLQIDPDACLAIGNGSRVFLEVQPYGGDWVAFPLDRSMFVREPTTLRLAHTGQLDVRVVGAAPGGASSRIDVRIRDVRREPESKRPREHVEDGRALFTALALDLELEVTASNTGYTLDPPTVRCKGPSAPGESARVELSLAPTCELVGRAFDRAGEAIVNTSLRFDFGFDQRSFMTDAAGRFSIPMAEVTRAKLPANIDVRFRELHATARIPQPANGTIDLGDLVLAP